MKEKNLLRDFTEQKRQCTMTLVTKAICKMFAVVYIHFSNGAIESQKRANLEVII